jgi:hypothetical protein
MSVSPVGPEPPGSGRQRLLEAYYAVLNDHPPFQAALAELFARLDALAETLPPPPPRSAGRADPGPPPSLPEAVQRELHRFCRAWPLPADAAADLWHSYAWWVSGGRRGSPRLLSRPAVVAAPTLPELARLGQAPLPLGLLLAGGEAALAALRRAQRLLRAAWAERLMAAGWVAPGPHERRAEMVERRARRLFLRLVLRMTFDAIADSESEQTGEPVGADTVRKSVTRDARLLGLRPS